MLHAVDIEATFLWADGENLPYALELRVGQTTETRDWDALPGTIQLAVRDQIAQGVIDGRADAAYDAAVERRLETTGGN